MVLYINGKKIKEIGAHGLYFNGKAINAAYYNGKKVYQYLPGATTFNAGSNLVTYTVPKGCTKLGIDCVASMGGTFKANGGNGGRVTCDLAVTPGQILYVTVGTIPTDAATPIYNASDIRVGGTDYSNRIIVAGGGGDGNNGSNATANGGHGGAGGGLTGANGTDVSQAGGGKGGTQTAGGGTGSASGYPAYGKTGEFGLGGKGAYGGNGGAGWYGGGGAAGSSYYGNWGGGGGGGSSYTSSACSNVVHTQGYQNGAGYIKITPKG